MLYSQSKRSCGFAVLVIAALLFAGCQPAQLAALLKNAKTMAQAGSALPSQIVAKGLNGPMGVFVDAQNNVWVIDSGTGGTTKIAAVDPETGQKVTAMMGDTARIVEISAAGKETTIANLPSVREGQEAIGGTRLAMLGDTLYATSGGWIATATDKPGSEMADVVKLAGGKLNVIAQPWMLEKEKNPDGFSLASHPYGVAAGPDGMLWVTDAAGNDLIKIDPKSDKMELVTVFGGLPGKMANPQRKNAKEAEPMPTGITFDKAGNAYVSLLTGAPHTPGAAKILMVTSNGKVSDYATGLTSLTDVRTGPDGDLYAVQFANYTDKGPSPDTGAILRIRAGGKPEIVLDHLPFPTSLAFDKAGDAYVTLNGTGTPGVGEVMKYSAMIKIAGRPLPKLS